MFSYQTMGVCSRKIDFEIENGILKKATFLDGCDGNLNGISSLVQGMKVEKVIERLKGIKCGSKSTSCPDQLATALLSVYKEK